MHENIKKRGISEQVYKDFQLSYSNNILTIPVFDTTGKILYNKYRHDTGDNKYTYDPGSSSALYASHTIGDSPSVIITEGELDTLVMISHGFKAVSATSGAVSNFKDEWVALLQDKKLYICYDNDTAGRKGAAKLKLTFPNAIVLFLEDVKDISEYYEKHGEVDTILLLTEGTLPEAPLPTTYEPRTTEPNDRIARAKQTPINEMAKFNRSHKTSCIFHSEKSASLHHNIKDNTFKCFGCDKFGDAIAFYMQLHNVDFQTALDTLAPPVTPAIHTTPAPTTTTPDTPIDLETKFLMTDSKKPTVRKIGANIKMIFDNDPDFADKFRYDSFVGRLETTFGSTHDQEWQPLEDDIIQSVTDAIQIKYPYFDQGMAGIIKNHVVGQARQVSVSPPLEYIKTIEWDKKPRLNKWLYMVYNVPDHPYYACIGARWLNGMVKRLAYPACQFDNVLVMEGKQNVGKSRVLRILCDIKGYGHLFNETTETPDVGKDFAIGLLGNMVVEFAEGAITGYKNQQKVKSFITKVSDKYRPPYLKNNSEFPRQCVFAMTTNEGSYLKDKTGERRYWPLPLGDGLLNWDWMTKNRDQLLAEAYTHIDDKYTALPDDVQDYWEGLVQERKEIDKLEDLIVGWYEEKSNYQKNEGVSVIDAEVIVDDVSLKSKYLPREIAAIFTHTLHLAQSRKKGKRVYRPKEELPDEEVKF